MPNCLSHRCEKRCLIVPPGQLSQNCTYQNCQGHIDFFVCFSFFPSHAAFSLVGVGGMDWVGVPTRASVINHTLKISEQGEIKQFLIWNLIQLANRIHVSNKKSNGFSSNQTAPLKQEYRIALLSTTNTYMTFHYELSVSFKIKSKL